MSRNEVLVRYNPTTQIQLCKNEQDCFFGSHPTLAQLNATYGQNTASVWLMPQLSNLVEFIGGENKMSGAVQQELAEIIAQEYQYLRTTELMLFFAEYKKASFGKQFGSLRTNDILQGLHTFVMERRADAKYKRIKDEEKAERERSYQEYLKNPATPEQIQKVLNKIKLKKV